MSSPPDVTNVLLDWSSGNPAALGQLIPLVYDELRRLANHYLRRERPGHTLQATALVNEAYLRLVNQQQVNWQSRAHFFGAAANLMRQILMQHARQRHAEKRGGEREKIYLDEAGPLAVERDMDLIALDDALNSLAAVSPLQSRLVELRYFGGLTIEETAEVLGLSPATVKRDWNMAKAWLHRELTRQREDV